MKTVIVCCLAVLFTACSGPATFQTRLYEISSPILLTVTWNTLKTGSGRGTMTVTAPDGEIFQGEWVTISNMSATDTSGSTFGSTSGSVVTNKGTVAVTQWGWATSFGFSLNDPGVQRGQFILYGDKGTVINGVYQINPLAGKGLLGAAEDNKGHRYKVMG